MGVKYKGVFYNEEFPQGYTYIGEYIPLYGFTDLIADKYYEDICLHSSSAYAKQVLENNKPLSQLTGDEKVTLLAKTKNGRLLISGFTTPNTQMHLAGINCTNNVRFVPDWYVNKYGPVSSIRFGATFYSERIYKPLDKDELTSRLYGTPSTRDSNSSPGVMMAIFKNLQHAAESLGAPRRTAEAPTRTLVMEPLPRALPRALPTDYDYETFKKEKPIPKTKAEAITMLKKLAPKPAPKPTSTTTASTTTASTTTASTTTTASPTTTASTTTPVTTASTTTASPTTASTTTPVTTASTTTPVTTDSTTTPVTTASATATTPEATASTITPESAAELEEMFKAFETATAVEEGREVGADIVKAHHAKLAEAQLAETELPSYDKAVEDKLKEDLPPSYTESQRKFVQTKISEKNADFINTHNMFRLSKKDELSELIESNKLLPGETTLDDYYNLLDNHLKIIKNKSLEENLPISLAAKLNDAMVDRIVRVKPANAQGKDHKRIDLNRIDKMRSKYWPELQPTVTKEQLEAALPPPVTPPPGEASKSKKKTKKADH